MRRKFVGQDVFRVAASAQGRPYERVLNNRTPSIPAPRVQRCTVVNSPPWRGGQCLGSDETLDGVVPPAGRTATTAQIQLRANTVAANRQSPPPVRGARAAFVLSLKFFAAFFQKSTFPPRRNATQKQRGKM